MNNPYTLVFGKAPSEMISRMTQFDEVIDNFTSEVSSQQVYMVTGVRGSGKTVFMTEIAGRLRMQEDWIVVELNPEKDLLTALAAKLASENKLAQLFKRSKINLSMFGIGLEVSGEAPIADIETAVAKMLETLKKQGKRVLITVDEVVNNQYVKEFVAAYQILIRQDLLVYLLMTGLYDNINSLQNEKSLTFLYRAPKIELAPLNMGAIARNYMENFKIEKDTAVKMAKVTRGYSFAFQVLGYFTWENGGDYKKAISRFRQYLDEYVYDKVWSELSPKDRQILTAIANHPNGKIAEIREELDIETNEFNPYRKRLIKKGIINGDQRGIVTFTLPMFEDYVTENS